MHSSPFSSCPRVFKRSDYSLINRPPVQYHHFQNPRPWRHGNRGQLVVPHGFGEDLQKFFDSLAFENWAPRSSQAWRLGKTPRSMRKENIDQAEKDEKWRNLAEKIERSGSFDDESLDEELTSATKSFVESSDQEFSSALNERIEEMVGASGNSQDSDEEGGNDMTGEELRALIFSKYGKYYDAEFAVRKFLGKDVVALNIMWVHVYQVSFPMSEADYNEKLDGIALLLNTWDRAGKVRAFLKGPRKISGGLPSRPIVGCAVSIRLDLDETTIDDWFSNR